MGCATLISVCLLQWLSHLVVDFVCLPETHVSSCSECFSWFSPYGFQSLASPGTAHSCGSVILYRSTFELSRSSFDFSGRFVLAHFKFRDSLFGVACVYAPNRNPERNDFFTYCASEVDPSVPTVICGDFNAVFNRALDRRGSSPLDLARESSTALGNLFSDCCVADVWRVLHPNTAVWRFVADKISTS